MNSNVKPVIESLRVTVKPSAQVAPNLVLTVVSHQGEVIVQRRFITVPMVLLSEGQLQMLRMLASSPHTIETCDLSEVAEAYAQWTQESDDREFEKLLDQDRKEENKWDDGPREDLYLGR